MARQLCLFLIRHLCMRDTCIYACKMIAVYIVDIDSGDSKISTLSTYVIGHHCIYASHCVFVLIGFCVQYVSIYLFIEYLSMYSVKIYNVSRMYLVIMYKIFT